MPVAYRWVFIWPTASHSPAPDVQRELTQLTPEGPGRYYPYFLTPTTMLGFVNIGFSWLRILSSDQSTGQLFTGLRVSRASPVCRLFSHFSSTIDFGPFNVLRILNIRCLSDVPCSMYVYVRRLHSHLCVLQVCSDLLSGQSLFASIVM